MTGISPIVTATGVSGATTGAHGPARAPARADMDRAVTVTVTAGLPGRVHLTKQEVFEACQALADADPVLVAAGRVDEARALGDLFELLEDRLTDPSLPPGCLAV